MVWIVAPLWLVSASDVDSVGAVAQRQGWGDCRTCSAAVPAPRLRVSTVVERNLDRITVVAAVVFGFSAVAYALIF